MSIIGDIHDEWRDRELREIAKRVKIIKITVVCVAIVSFAAGYLICWLRMR